MPRTDPGSVVTFSDMGMDPLIHLERIMSEVYLPLLSNPRNQEGWGDVTAKELMDKLHGFLSQLSITVGQTKGETCLPLPPIDASAPEAAAGGGSASGSLDMKDRVHLLEGAVITWTKQIKGVLKQDPEALLKQGKHPPPSVEIKFWRSKADNLNAIFDQLQSERIRRVLHFLDSARSTYCTPFAKLCKEVFAARLEANDNVKYLRTLDSWFDHLANDSGFQDLHKLFKPIMHILLLIWKNSKFYNTPARLVVVIREVCNAIIDQATSFVSGKQVFDLLEDEEEKEAVSKLQTALRVCGEFKAAYTEYKATANAECPENPWRIQNNALFLRLDSFIERCYDVLEMTEIIIKFTRLERIVVGGTKGEVLTTTVRRIFDDFRRIKGTLQVVPYDILDVQAKAFDTDFFAFRQSIKELERRLASVMTQGFDDQSTISGRFKLLDSFDMLLERPIIQDELERKHISLIHAYGIDLKRVQEIFLTEREQPPISWNLPPVAGALTWCRNLKERIGEPMSKLRDLHATVMEREESKEVIKLYTTLMSSLEDYEHQKVEEWGGDVDRTTQAKLKLSLLTRGKMGPYLITTGDPAVDSKLLQVNFDPALVRLLREVKYFLSLGLEVPPSALQVYQRASVYRKQTASLDLMVNMYNQMMYKLLPVEAPLMRGQITKIDSVMNTGLEVISWKSGRPIDDFIGEVSALVKAAHSVLFKLKGNLEEVAGVLNDWCDTPMLQRKPKPMTPDEFENMYRTVRAQRYTAIKAGGQKIDQLLRDSHSIMAVSRTHPNWEAYTDFVNGIVVQGLSKMVVRSLEELVDQLSTESIVRNHRQPMLVVQLALADDGIFFRPPIREERSGSVYHIVLEWVDSFFQGAGQLKRLDDPDGKYVKELAADIHVQMLMAQLYDCLDRNRDACEAHRAEYMAFEPFWAADLEEEYKKFCAKATKVEHPRLELEAGSDDDDDDESAQEGEVEAVRVPDLEAFDAELLRLERLQEQVAGTAGTTDIGWLRVQNDPVKLAIGKLLQRWCNRYTKHLVDFVQHELEDLERFMQRVADGVTREVDESDPEKESLKFVMAIIRDVKQCQARRDFMFTPFKQTVALLKSHGVPLDDRKVAGLPLVEFLEGAPLRWKDTVTRTYAKREEIFSLQSEEAEVIKRQVDEFFKSMRAFRRDFRKNAPFAFGGEPDEAYAKLDAYKEQLDVMEAAAEELNNLESLFELPISKYQETVATRQEMLLLKGLWDIKSMISHSYEDWRSTLWVELDTDALQDMNKKLREYLKAFGERNAIVKGWTVYRDIEAAVKDMDVSLPLVSQLASPAMRQRHWDSLADVCDVKALDPTDPQFSLDSLLSLQLHRHGDDVEEVVLTADRDLRVERQLAVINEAWKVHELEFVQHKDTEMFVIKVRDETIEDLETHQMDLQGLQGSDFFQRKVNEWQEKLGSVEEVIREWVSVTKQWANLEVVFLTSEDIKESLPEDTKRFDQINKDFEELMKSAQDTPNVVEACTKDGRKEALKDMNRMLDQCQRSLNEYLDMKKKKFPRFYFVSNVDLLDILSNGANPPRIMKHLGSCYDAISTLTFEEAEEEGAVQTVASSMVAKDGETIHFKEPFHISGPVEDWLNDFTDKMHITLRGECERAVEGAVNWENELPRHREWLSDLPAQVALVGTQIFWTEETHHALDDFEQGTDDAVKKYLGVCNDRLYALIGRVMEPLSRGDRTKIITLITLDVHARDVVQTLIDQKAEGPGSFLWAQQLRFAWDVYNKDIDIAITDFSTKYSYEWVGNQGRLVITPLTDRCYITLTMALRLMLGGAPAGPAGTGKTETTKDLSRAIGLPIYVFNCSDQMTYQSVANIFKGLAQTGAWGCFDEFNRISIEVLSVVATQVKQVLDATKLYAKPENRPEEYQHLPRGQPPSVVGEFELQGDIIKLVPTVGMFITMNPGYAGRTELPENLKALFRSCAMIRPDLEPICENMLLAEGFKNARPLAVKFVTLYSLSSELLSPQVHYDWGLRAVKAVLRVAGGLKRAEPGTNEDAVLMRALRDFNTPKMPTPDIPIFLRLVQDLFPQHFGVVPKFDEVVEKGAIEAAKRANLQFDKVFIAKVVQFQELLNVRHSVMILGPAGCGKTTIWKTLAGHHNLGAPANKLPLKYDIVNPKAVTSNELYGYMTLGNDWKDGCLSIIMRGMSKNNRDLGYHEYQKQKWVVLDDDIDSVWIESMNTVMDDNKVLTLVSNERVPLTDAMRMVFEINSLRNATPATVSRAGILFVNEGDVGWRPFVESWINSRESENERAHLPALFERYVEEVHDRVRRSFKTVTPIRIINQVTSICRMLESLLPQLPADPNPEQVEHCFVMALMWAFGGALIVEAGEGKNHRRNFHEIFVELVSGSVKFPREVEGDDKPLCFDFFYKPNPSNAKGAVGELVQWKERVEEYVPVPIGVEPGEVPFGDITVQTVDSVRLTTIMNQLVTRGHPVMFVGTAGTGKTTLVRDYLKTLDSEAFLSKIITMNFFTDSKSLQVEIDSGIDKRSGKTFGPPAGKKQIFYVDDLNLPYIEEYGTQNSLSLLRQMMDHKQYYDRADLSLRKEMVDCQYIASMNPTSGSFFITERLQRFFTTFASLMPSDSDLTMIYGSILQGHLATFTEPVAALKDSIVANTIALHKTVARKFLPSATTFVYNWNMRELSNVFQGLTSAKSDFYPKPINFLRLWAHECTRVFHDRMPTSTDAERFEEVLVKLTDKAFKEVASAEAIFEGPLIFTKFAAQPSSNPTYLPLPAGDTGMEILSRTLGTKLIEHNEGKVVMNLVLFEQAMEHVCRIARIISNPSGNAMLVGVGGSGKQSLTRLAAFICGYEVVQLQVSAKFTEADFREALQGMFKQAGGKGIPTVFIMTDSQIVNERFLVYLNDILSSSWVTGLFEREDLDEVYGLLRNEAKAAGIAIDSPDAMLEYFISRIRSNLHVVLCFSPVGSVFRVRARRFPGLINCTSNDYFHPWPRDALVSVAESNIQDIEAFGSEEVCHSVAEHMADAHLAVTEVSRDYASSQGRHNHVTPKSFLELIGFYRYLLDEKLKQSQGNIERLDDGLSKLVKTGEDVAELQRDLQYKMTKVEEEVSKTDLLLEEIKEQSADAAEQEAAASVVRESATKAKAAAEAIQADADKELAEAMPALEAATAALQNLPLKAIQTMKSYASPPAAIMQVCTPLLMMLAGELNPKKHTWDAAKRMMKAPKEFLDRCVHYAQHDAKVMSDKLVSLLQPIYDDPEFTVEKMTKTSDAAGALTLFVRSTVHFNRVWVKVEPLMIGLEEANKSKEEANAQLAEAEATLAQVQAKLAALNEKLADAEAAKKVVEDEAAACQAKLGLAERLVNGLASEKERWGEEVKRLKEQEYQLVGDVLLGSAFVSYIGGFDYVYRNRLWRELWLPDIISKGIPVSETVDPLWLLTSEAKVAAMQNEGLPADRISTENGAITVASKRWPLLIDPQLQAIKWLRTRFEPPTLPVDAEGEGEGEDVGADAELEESGGAAAPSAAAATTLVVLQLTQDNWQRKMKNAILNGHTVIIENCSEELDATLDPVLSRAVVQRGKSFFVNFAGDDVEYHKDFELFLQTKLSNPHYKPETQAQCTLVNFIATEEGLKDQLLARVVQREKADLEARKQELAAAFNRYKVQLIELEDDLLNRLASAEGDLTANVALIEGLEATKLAAGEIQEAVAKGKQTEIEINTARQVYVPVAEEGAMLYFMITQLNAINHMYQYSLDAFMLYFYKAMDDAKDPEDAEARVKELKSTLRLTIYRWVSRGLFERHKLILMAQLTFQLMSRGRIGGEEEWSAPLFQFLLRGGRKTLEEKPSSLDWLPDTAWYTVQYLASLDGCGFEKLPADLDEAPARFKEWFNHVSPEQEKLPLDWAGLDKEPFKKLMVLKCMRPDRLNVALTNFISSTLPNGKDYVSCDSTLSGLQVLDQTLGDSKPSTPLYFILSPGADVVSDLDKLAVKFGKVKGESYHNIAMGQGQDKKAMEALELGNRQGHWVILNNVHLMPRWLTELEKRLDVFNLQGSHEEFRVFLTSEPANTIPIGVLSRSIKLTNEPPTGLKANLQRAFTSFSPEFINDMDSRMRAILFGLCHFHAVLIERKKFGPMGFNMMYPFSLGDLRDSAETLANYMENAGTKIPWEDLRYLFGQIMYGGHIVNDFDRTLVVNYLEHFMRDELLDEMELFPFNKDEDASFMSTSPTTYERYLEHIDERLKGDTPIAFGLHPNAEIGFRTAQSEELFRTLMDLQPRDAGATSDAATSPLEVARVVLSELLDTYGEAIFDLEDIGNSMEGDRGPFQNVLMLELEQMNGLLIEMKRSLSELKLGIDGVLTMTDTMEELRDALFLDRVPGVWARKAWPSLRSLAGWRDDLTRRLTQLNEWKDNPTTIPMVTWLSGLINPQSFLTAIRQQSAQATKQELDKLVIQTEVTKRMREEITDPARDGGAFVDGLFMQGARWDIAGGFVDKSKPREMLCVMPVLNCRAVTEDKLEVKNIYDCPVYKTEQRGPTYVFSAQLKTKSPASRWVMAGVALVMDAT